VTAEDDDSNESGQVSTFCPIQQYFVSGIIVVKPAWAGVSCTPSPFWK